MLKLRFEPNCTVAKPAGEMLPLALAVAVTFSKRPTLALVEALIAVLLPSPA